ncbi:MAG: thermonuclease family protein [Clostridia bacterium]|nr:thermonuclease family protein [Clostridia bacterium]
MKHKFSIRSLAMLLLVTLLLCSFVACKRDDEGDKGAHEHVDYVSQLKLDMNSSTAKQEVSVHIYIDGDTTHFKVPESVMEGGILKARYLAINTPESTGRIEPWGKAASNFTKERLKNATSIIIESDNETWNADSTGGRYLVWVWYKTAEMTEYRNLNLEILQNGLAIASNSAQNRYGDMCVKAIDQAKAEKLYVYSVDQDPNFHYGAAEEMTLKELRTNITSYEGTKVAFEGVISAIYDGSFYVEEYDEETGMCYGVSAYYQTGGLPGKATEFIQLGNRVRVVGSVTYFEAGDIWQVSGLTYSLMKPDDPSNFTLISSGHEPAYTLTSPTDFLNKKITMVVNVTEDGEEIEKEKTFDYAELALDTSISMNDLVVTSTKANDKGEVTLTCSSGGVTIKVFLGLLYDADGNRITKDTYANKIINVRGLVDKYYENYQIRVLSVEDITVLQ